MADSPEKQAKTLKETLISELPKTLFFNIHRVNYDVKLKRLVKNNKKFDFEKVIYMDRFMLNNRSSDERINKQILKIREQ